MGRRAFITGITGQDGAYLARLLLDRGYSVAGGARHIAGDSLWRLRELGVLGRVDLAAFDLRDTAALRSALAAARPDEIYNFAALSFVGVSFAQPAETAETNAAAVAHMLETVRQLLPTARFYQASSSEMFGSVAPAPQNERTAFRPVSPYAAAKVEAHLACRSYRETHGLFACAGIAFNHESPLRAPAYVTRKIAAGMVALRRAGGSGAALRLGNLDARRDWGWAEDYVRGMAAIVAHAEPDEFVLATGEAHSVREFAAAAAAAVGYEIEWSGRGTEETGRDRASGRILVAVDPQYFRPADIVESVGDFAKAQRVLGWRPAVGFEELVGRMVKAEFDRPGQPAPPR
ncbi:MAG: GDP-mannose 4,6-dehydratase [Candidatus Odyssella sp.]|nr:GDP-mannose 4,6-dehydratase [Candidatus Odyssella sp.]